LSLDELQNKKKELIEDYANKIEGYRKALEMTETERSELESSTKEDLENYKLQNLNLFSEEVQILSHKEKLLYNELKKKEYEVRENQKLNSSNNEEDTKDVTSLISNLNKLTANKSNEDGTEYKNILDILNKKKIKNKGYAFVTFATSEEAKIFYLTHSDSFTIKKTKAEVFPKFDLTHEDVDEDLLYSKAKLESNIINRKSELIESEKKLKEFLTKFYDNLDSNEKHKEFETVRDAFKDLYSDPFKKHDHNNPFTAEEEEEIKYRAKLSGRDNTWLFEDDKIEKMRKSRDKRITKKYTEAEFLKRGIISEEFFRKDRELENKSEEKYTMIKDFSNSYFNSSENVDLYYDNDYTGKSGRRLKRIGTKEFIEKNLSRDYLENTIPGFEKDKRESVIYEEIKELRERFPKNKFLDDPASGEKFIKEVNAKFVNLLKEEDKTKLNENAKEELLDRLTNLSPMGKKIQMIVNERNIKVQDEGVRQLMTIQNFYEKRIDNASARNSSINEVPEHLMDAITRNQYLFENTPEKDFPEAIEEIYPPPVVQREEEAKVDEGEAEVTESGVKTEGDTSFRAFLQRRKAIIDEKEGEEKKDQFDPNNLSLDEINKVKDDVTKDLLNSIGQKYKKFYGQIGKNSSSGLSIKHDGGVYDYIQSEVNVNKKNKRDHSKLVKNLESQIEKEKVKEKFLAELEKNFSDELQTLPNFREYFVNLKNSNNKNSKSDINLAEEPIFNYSKYAKDFKPSSTRKEEMSLLYSSEKISPELFEKTFVINQNTREKRFDEWISQQDMEDIQRIALNNHGYDLEDNDTVEFLKLQIPELFDVNANSIKENEQTKSSDELMEKINNIEERDEVEYYFNPDCGETIEEHLASLAKTKFNKVLIRTDTKGRIIIRREFKNNYKYDLDEIMQYDIKKERERMLKKLENFDFKTELDANVEYYSQFYQLVSDYDCFNSGDVNAIRKEVAFAIQKVEDLNKLSYENFSFDDFKRLTDNLLQLKPRSLTNFVNHVINLINLISNQEANESYSEISQVLKEISEFSKDIFNEREVRIFVDLIKANFNNKFNERVKEFDNMSKFYFIQNVLLKDFFLSLKNILSPKEVAYIYGILKMLPVEGINLSSIKVLSAKPKLKKILWKNYKNYMLKEFNILKKKEKELKPNSYIDIITEQIQIYNDLKTESGENLSEVEKEIEEFGVKIKNYYVELANASKIF
jgi:hypothetical protein